MLDIDNTVMAMDNDLGSDQWFEWQKYLLENEPNSPYLVAETFRRTARSAGHALQPGAHAPAADGPARADRRRCRSWAFARSCSRRAGPSSAWPPSASCKRSGYDFAATALPVHDVPGGNYLAVRSGRPGEETASPPRRSTTFKLGEPRPVSYANGIFMTAGQHKGVMLLTLLHDADRDIKAVVYVDDNVRHVGNVFCRRASAAASEITVVPLPRAKTPNVQAVPIRRQGGRRPPLAASSATTLEDSAASRTVEASERLPSSRGRNRRRRRVSSACGSASATFVAHTRAAPPAPARTRC